MASKCDLNPFGYALHSHGHSDARAVPLEGVPQIPQPAIDWMRDFYDLPPQLAAAADAAIAEARLEIRRRYEAMKLGVELDQYFGRAELACHEYRRREEA
jgi:hypothetical protein